MITHPKIRAAETPDYHGVVSLQWDEEDGVGALNCHSVAGLVWQAGSNAQRPEVRGGAPLAFRCNRGTPLSAPMGGGSLRGRYLALMVNSIPHHAFLQKGLSLSSSYYFCY